MTTLVLLIWTRTEEGIVTTKILTEHNWSYRWNKHSVNQVMMAFPVKSTSFDCYYQFDGVSIQICYSWQQYLICSNCRTYLSSIETCHKLWRNVTSKWKKCSPLFLILFLSVVCFPHFFQLTQFQHVGAVIGAGTIYHSGVHEFSPILVCFCYFVFKIVLLNREVLV